MDTIIGLAAYGVVALAILIPLYVIVRSVINYVRATDGRGTIVLKALLVLGIWVILSFTLLMLALMSAFEGGKLPDGTTASRPVTIIGIVFAFFYVVIGLLMAFWVKLQPGWKTLRKAQSES